LRKVHHCRSRFNSIRFYFSRSFPTQRPSWVYSLFRNWNLVQLPLPIWFVDRFLGTWAHPVSIQRMVWATDFSREDAAFKPSENVR